MAHIHQLLVLLLVVFSMLQCIQASTSEDELMEIMKETYQERRSSKRTFKSHNSGHEASSKRDTVLEEVLKELLKDASSRNSKKSVNVGDKAMKRASGATCKQTDLGTEYDGMQGVTETGRACQPWSMQWPHEHYQTDPSMFPDASIEDAFNFCRNPDSESVGPWCYTMDPDVRWEACGIPFCSGGYVPTTAIPGAGPAPAPAPSPSNAPDNCGRNKYKKRSALETLLETIEKGNDLAVNDLQDLTQRILGGQEAKGGQWPWIAHMRNTISTCGASLITPEWVVTAAHCFVNTKMSATDPANVEIHLGEQNLDWNAIEANHQVIIPSKVIIHSGWDPIAIKNDIAMVKLPSPVTLNEDVNVVCLPQARPAPGTNCVAAGWGRDKSGQGTLQLKHLFKKIQADNECTRFSGIPNGPEPGMICAIAPSGVDDVCGGDSGGPLVCESGGRYELVGAVSFGDACANQKRTSGIYADIFYYKSWIEDTMRNN